MRKFISIIIAILTMAIATPASAGGSGFSFSLDLNSGQFVLQFRDGGRKPYYDHRVRRHQHGLYRYRSVQPRYGRHDNYRRHEQRPPRGSWRIHSGDYCEGRMYFYRGDYYCGR